jgi:hypothetical protein
VRNPWDVVVSNYFYIRKDGSFWHSSDGSTKFKLKEDHSLVNKLSFKQFVEKLVEGVIEDKFVVRSQNSWIRDSDLDFIIKFENLQEDFNTVCDKIGIPKQKLPHINKTEHKHYTEYYDDETRQIVAEKYAKDIEYFGYEFGE